MRRAERRVIAPIVIGLIGTAILIGLGIWQVQRLAWKEALIARLESRLAAEPQRLPAEPQPGRHDYLRVAFEGRLGEGAVYLLTTLRPHGPGYRVIAPVATAGERRVLADLGYIPAARKDEVLPEPGTALDLTGALFWPEGGDYFTPEPELEENIWFARDAAAMAAALDTEPVLVIAERHSLGDWPLPRRLGIGLPNDHLEYAITWFSLAVIWAVMSVLWLRRERTAVRAD